MSGRGRGISNAPAWMTRGNNNNNNGDNAVGGGGGGLPPPPPPPDFGGGGGGGGGHHDDFGRAAPPPHHNRGGGGGGGGGRPPPHWRGGGGGGGGGGPRHGHRDGGHRGGGGGNRDRDHHRGGGNGNPPPASTAKAHFVRFRSYEEEQDWVDDRRRKRQARQAVESKFDKPPTAEQLRQDAMVGAISNPAATDFSGIQTSSRGGGNGGDFNNNSIVALPQQQQTRHARRLYVGQLPMGITEQELHDFFRQSIATALVDNNGVKIELRDDPILSVYVNHERRFCFVEFKSVEMTTACMAFDGINVNGRGKVKVKRPNDYTPHSAPPTNPANMPNLDVSKLGIVSGTVNDGPNKIFIGGLHYHLTEPQIMQLLEAFGKVKAFHLVKNDPDSMTSKGYCFAEYADPNVTPIAVQGLNGMDLGGGKTITARVANQRSNNAAAAVPTPTSSSSMQMPMGGIPGMQQPPSMVGSSTDNTNSNLPQNVNIVGGYNIEELVDAAMGTKVMPTTPTYLDQYGMPLTRIVHTITPGLPAAILPPGGITSAGGMAIPPPPPTSSSGGVGGSGSGPSPLDIANAALSALGGVPPPPPQPQPTLSSSLSAIPTTTTATRILVLSNMVTDEDLATDEEYNGLKEEVEEEVRKHGMLLSMNIPRPGDVGTGIEASAIRKIFLEYATTEDAINAQKVLNGRQFGPMVVETSYFDETLYAAKKIKLKLNQI